jgi:hypothetical protein
MKKVFLALLMACATGLLLSALPIRTLADSSLRRVVVHDPANDQTGSIDVMSMELDFDASTGDYEITLVAHPQNPFFGVFRVNINLFDPDTGTTAQNPSFFQDDVNDFNLVVPTTTIMLAGSNPRLMSWNVGDRVYTNSLAGTGNPDGIKLSVRPWQTFPSPS